MTTAFHQKIIIIIVIIMDMRNKINSPVILQNKLVSNFNKNNLNKKKKNFLDKKCDIDILNIQYKFRRFL